MNKVLKMITLLSFAAIVSSCKLMEIAIEELENYYEEEQASQTNTTNNVTNNTNTATNQTQITEEQLAEKWKDGPNTIAHGKSGFLWKPTSDNDGYPVVIIGPRFTNKTPRFVLVNGEKWDRVSVANGYREHYRADRSNKKHYTGAVTVEVTCKDGLNGTASNKWKWTVPDATKRWDSNVTPTFVKI